MIEELDRILEGSNRPGLTQRVSRDYRCRSRHPSREVNQIESSALSVVHGVRGEEEER